MECIHIEYYIKEQFCRNNKSPFRKLTLKKGYFIKKQILYIIILESVN